jgi:hypothetical protein
MNIQKNEYVRFSNVQSINRSVNQYVFLQVVEDEHLAEHH